MEISKPVRNQRFLNGMKILFIVTSFNNERCILETLSSILNQRGNFLKDILVIDDGSQDNSVPLIRKLAQEYREIKLIQQKHQGQASALNRGIDKAQHYDFVALVEADVKIEKNWLFKNIKKFTKSNIAGVGGKLKPFSQDNWIARLAGYEVEYKMEKQKKYPLHLTSANVIYRSSIFKKIGKFQKELANACFDAEFNLRVIRTGFYLVYNKKAYAWHHYKPTLRFFLKRVWAYARYRPYLQGITSYPYDNIIRIQVMIILILFLGLPLILINYLFLSTFYLLLFTYYLLTTLPPLLWTLKHKKDFVMLLYPLISFLRNTVALVALAFGILSYYKTKINNRTIK